MLATSATDIQAAYAWQYDTALYLSGASQTCIIPYVTKVIICDGVENIGAFACAGGTSLNTVKVGEGLTEIGDFAFVYCNNFTEITLAEAIEDVGESAFWLNEGNLVINVPNENAAKALTGSYYGVTAQVKIENEEEILKDTITAADVKEHPVIYCGKEVTGYSCTNSAGVEKWKIYHADDNNIYLIADNYISYDYIPAKDGVKMTQNTSYTNGAYFGSDLLAKYTGAENITNSNITPWLSYLNSYGTSTNNNMKAVAYFLDTDVWSGFKGEDAKYAIGAPTLDMFVASYNSRSNRKIDMKIEEDGYNVKFADEDESEHKYYVTSNDYLLAKEYIEDAAHWMWLASPSAGGSGDLYGVDYDGYVSGTYYGTSREGVCPLVCLESSVSLEKTEVNGEVVYNIK